MRENIFSRLKRQNSQSLMQAQMHFDKGVRLTAEGQLSKAVKAYLWALEIDPRFVTAYKHLGAAYDELGQFVDALKVYAKAIVLTPQDPELRIDLGLVYFNIGSYNKSIKAFNQALDIDSHNARAHYCLGLDYLDLGDIQISRSIASLST
jgi:tetratricopeptide (TPR) repeat protein